MAVIFFHGRYCFRLLADYNNSRSRSCHPVRVRLQEGRQTGHGVPTKASTKCFPKPGKI